jgi:CBS domain-containing protein
MVVSEACSREVVFARLGNSARAAAQLMRQYHVGAIVVVNEFDRRRVSVGVLTDRDIAIAVAVKALDAGLLWVEEADGRKA